MDFFIFLSALIFLCTVCYIMHSYFVRSKIGDEAWTLSFCSLIVFLMLSVIAIVEGKQEAMAEARGETTKTTSSVDRFPRVDKPADNFRLYKDLETGCTYIRVSDFLTPLLGSDGKPRCTGNAAWEAL